MKQNLVFFIAFLFTIGFGLSACKSSLYSHNHDFSDKRWLQKDSIVFTPEIKDTKKSYQLVLEFRHSDKYPCKNIIFLMSIVAPSGKRMGQLYDMPLAADDGRWTGDWLGDIVDQTFILKRNFTFPEAGKYAITFTQQMRDADYVAPVVSLELSIKESK